MPGESILWQGRPVYHRWLGLLVVIPTILFSLIYIDPTPFHIDSTTLEQLRGTIAITGLVTLLWLRLIFKYGGVSYYITNRRIVLKQDLPILRTIKEIPLEELSAVKSRHYFRKGFMAFMSSKAFPLDFGYLKDDVDKLRHLAETAKQSMSC